jgi:hypothetical protein
MVKAVLVSFVIVGALLGLVRSFERRFAFVPTKGESSTPADLGIPFETTAANQLLEDTGGVLCGNGRCRMRHSGNPVGRRCGGLDSQ